MISGLILSTSSTIGTWFNIVESQKMEVLGSILFDNFLMPFLSYWLYRDWLISRQRAGTGTLWIWGSQDGKWIKPKIFKPILFVSIEMDKLCIIWYKAVTNISNTNYLIFNNTKYQQFPKKRKVPWPKYMHESWPFHRKKILK